MEDQDYLIHYGVLGMKWGVRKDKRYKYTSMRTKHLTKKLSKAKAKGKKNVGKISEKLKTSKQTDKNLLAYAKKTSVGKAIAQDILLGPGGAKSYQTMRANGVSRGHAITSQIIAKAVGAGVGFVGGTIVGGKIGQNIVTSLGLDKVSVPAQMAIYNKELEKLVKRGLESGIFSKSKYQLAGRSLKLPYSLKLNLYPTTPNTLYSKKTLKFIEDSVADLAQEYAQYKINNLKADNVRLGMRINSISTKIGQKVGSAGTAYTIGARQKKKR